ncbi:Hypothetical protein FKW44_016199, partial [Caligus rogercresseyi]
RFLRESIKYPHDFLSCAIEEIESIKSKEIEIVVIFSTNSERDILSDEENGD